MTDDTSASSPRTEPSEWQFDRDETTTDSETSLFGRVSSQLNSRRDFMNSAAKVGLGATALGAAGTGTAAAQENGPADSPFEERNPFGYGALTDLQLLEFALLLERLEATFYTDAVGNSPVKEGKGSNGAGPDARLSEAQVERDDLAAQLANPSLRYSMFVRFKQIRNHEQTHVEALEGVIAEVREEGNEEANPEFGSNVEFQFPYETFGEFLGLAQAIEDTGAAAYTGAAPAIDEEAYLASAAQIVVVEGRHASYVRTLDNPLPDGSGALNPFPRAFQQKLSVSEVVGAIEPFVVGADAEDIVGLLG